MSTARSLRVPGLAWSVGGLFLGLVAWEIVGRVIDMPTLFAPASATFLRAVELTLDGSLPSGLWSSLQLYGVGLIAAIIVAYPMALLLARVHWLRVGLEDYIAAVYATPTVALIPFLLAILGFGFFPKAIIVFLFVFFPVYLNTLEGARSIAPELLEVAQVFKCSGRDLWFHVILPYTLPFAMTGVRQGMAVGLVGVVAAEFFLSSTGLSQVILISTQRFDAAAILACSLVLALLGVALMALGRLIESRFAAWRV